MSAAHMSTATARPAFRHAALALALTLSLAACGDKGQETTDTGTQTPATPTETTPTPAASQTVSAQIAAMSVDQLRSAASAAQAEQRMYAPAGNNAMEYYLALRDKQPNDAAVSSALTDLMPYAVIATEQSIARDDFAEAQRLLSLMEKTDKAAPALPRLKQSLSESQASFAQRQQQQEVDAEAEKARLAKLEEQRKLDQEKAQREAAQKLAQQQQTQQADAARAAEAQRQADAAKAAEAQRQAEAARQAEAQRQAAARAATPATATANDLRPISTPPPKYPVEALRANQSGDVLVEFTVATDGSVTSARVVRANPPRVFDREAVAAVKRWRFQPVGNEVTTRRTIGFKPSN